jgi:hypothetical protein
VFLGWNLSLNFNLPLNLSIILKFINT